MFIPVLFTDKDDCEGSPCKNGADCVDKLNGFECKCVPGYTGTHCDISKYIEQNIFLNVDSSLYYVQI